MPMNKGVENLCEGGKVVCQGAEIDYFIVSAQMGGVIDGGDDFVFVRVLEQS